MEESELLPFLSKEIQAIYRVGRQISIAEGKLEVVAQGFMKIVGRKGTIVINEKNLKNIREIE